MTAMIAIAFKLCEVTISNSSIVAEPLSAEFPVTHPVSLESNGRVVTTSPFEKKRSKMDQSPSIRYRLGHKIYDCRPVYC